MKTYKNSRGEFASTDGACWWSGDADDEVSMKLNALQPISTLFDEVADASVSKARRVFIACLNNAAPTVAPENEAEREILRQAWEDATEFAAKNEIIAAGVPVFDCKLHLVGAADAVIKAKDGSAYTFCYAPKDFKWCCEVNAIVRILFNGFPIDCCDDPFGHYRLENLTRAAAAIVTRDQTAWYREWAKNQPF